MHTLLLLRVLKFLFQDIQTTIDLGNVFIENFDELFEFWDFKYQIFLFENMILINIEAKIYSLFLCNLNY